MNDKVKIFIVDDHKMILDGLIHMLSKYQEFEVIGTSLTGQDAIKAANLNGIIDIFITDINLPDLDGLVLINTLKHSYPESKFIVLSMHNNKTIIRSAFQKGIMGYVLKNSGEEDLVEAIRFALEDKKFVSKEALSNLIDSFAENDIDNENNILTDRETTIAKLTSKGLTSAEIASVLFISPRTVETHRRNIMHKLGFKNQGELIKYAIESAWID
ncbi:MAG: response regulator transcription factor [Candidatus Kapabacteria bacterium]|nr:response regulator transcription factor [Ignavibacteriota bacterium]MCW5884562.1 response regulator transcription factor [Candidatus Kapabacteria bacterium]